MAHRPDYESADYKEGYEDGKREASKEWQSLSDEDKVIIAFDKAMPIEAVIAVTEAKLREKNG